MRRWPGAAYRGRPIRELSIGLRDLGLHRCLRSGLAAAEMMPDCTGKDISLEYDG